MKTYIYAVFAVVQACTLLREKLTNALVCGSLKMLQINSLASWVNLFACIDFCVVTVISVCIMRPEIMMHHGR